MITVVDDFRQRVREVRLYIRWLEAIETHDSRIIFGSERATEFDPDFRVILRANSFLILYNLVEATMYDVVEEICNQLNESKSPFTDLKGEVQRSWVAAQLKNLRDAAPDTWSEQVWQIVNTIRFGHSVKLDYLAVMKSAAGSLDARKIRSIVSSLGMRHDIPKCAMHGEKLLTVKDRRNNLAHGDKTFVECGRDYQISDIRNIQRQVLVHLWSLLKCASRYLAQNEFRPADMAPAI